MDAAWEALDPTLPALTVRAGGDGGTPRAVLAVCDGHATPAVRGGRPGAYRQAA